MSAEVELDETAIRAACESGQFDVAMTLAFDRYADELFGFLRGLSADLPQADDAFGATCERIWRGIQQFRWECSFRAWAFQIARNEFLRSTREVGRARRSVPISDVPSVQRIVDRVRSATPVYQRDEVKDRFLIACRQLPPEDHMLLGLRIEQRLSWIEIARVLAVGDDEPSPKEIAALRKRFERLKAKIRTLASGAEPEPS